MPGNQFSRCKPSPRALELGQKVRIIFWTLLLCSILMMVAQDWQGPLMAAVVAVMVGWCSMRESPNVYKIDKIRCFCLICGYCFATTLVHVIYVRVNPSKLGISEGQSEMIAIVANSVALVLFGAGTYLSKQLYDELRLNHQFPDPEYMEERSFFGGSGPSQATQPNGQNAQGRQQGRMGGWGQPRQQAAAAPPPQQASSGSRGFQAFQGQGHSLS